MADEALVSFQSLLESVPGWISDLSNILSTATTQQLMLAQEYATAEGQYSTHQQPSLTTGDLLRLSQRKRKTASVCSRTDSKAQSESRQCLATIYYDGNTQKKFESLVRAVGSSRNSIRKGRLSMRLDNMIRSGSSSSSCSSEGEETIKGLGTFTYRSTTTLRRSPVDNKESTAAFDKIDAALEKAQMHCERAAHQILREGDCSIDITQARQHFHDTMTTITNELPVLQKKADKAFQRRRAEDEKLGLEERQSSQSSDGHSLPSDGMLEVDSDEVPDSDNDDFDISSMSLPPHMGKYNGSPRRLQPAIAAVA